MSHHRFALCAPSLPPPLCSSPLAGADIIVPRRAQMARAARLRETEDATPAADAPLGTTQLKQFEMHREFDDAIASRHNWVRNALAASLNRMLGVQAVLEPMVRTRRAPEDQRRGAIKVIKSGTSWILDVGIIC